MDASAPPQRLQLHPTSARCFFAPFEILGKQHPGGRQRPPRAASVAPGTATLAPACWAEKRRQSQNLLGIARAKPARCLPLLPLRYPACRSIRQTCARPELVHPRSLVDPAARSVDGRRGYRYPLLKHISGAALAALRCRTSCKSGHDSAPSHLGCAACSPSAQ